MPRRARFAVVGLVLIAACAGGSGDQQPSGRASETAPSPTESVFAGPTFRNPVYTINFPDPGVMKDDDTYYAYATTNGIEHVQTASSTDLVEWDPGPDALRQPPAWGTADIWAPEVWQTDAGYVMYYTIGDTNTRRPDIKAAQCISVGVADSPEGPFVDARERPLVCQGEEGGSIDASPFQDADGTRYLLWKNDGNCCNLPTHIWIAPLTPDGLELAGEPIDTLAVSDAAWEGGVVEAPTLVLRDATYYLFFSASFFDSASYAVGYATSEAVSGPYEDGVENPILRTPDDPDPTDARGPGHQSIVEAPDGSTWVLYHAWDDDFSARSMWLDELVWEEGRPRILGPDDEEQPAP
ncbi:MAG TPA: glycoside hydrolase family 43 protein [Candidatus Limnocylindria bacterium]|nr:glycoside hydrolase family 43 protein [Candidatus Limnocylindria bacterium]